MYPYLTNNIGSIPASVCVLCWDRYKDNPFTAGDGFGSRWDSDGGVASFTSSWALENEEPKEEVTISSIQPIGERPSRRKAEAAAPVSVSESSEARQKFANAKAISSDMFFGRESYAEVKLHHCITNKYQATCQLNGNLESKACRI